MSQWFTKRPPGGAGTRLGLGEAVHIRQRVWGRGNDSVSIPSFYNNGTLIFRNLILGSVIRVGMSLTLLIKAPHPFGQREDSDWIYDPG